MVPPLITDAEWDTYKPFIEREYLTNNKTAAAVARELGRQYNVPISERRLKIKFDTWKWDKKIPAAHYHAMYRVIQDLNQKMVFIIPTMGGRNLRRLDSSKVTKETQRKKSNKSTKTQPHGMDLETAHKTLQEAGITIELCQNPQTIQFRHTVANSQSRLAANGTQIAASLSTPLDRDIQGPMEQPEEYDDYDNDDDDDHDDHDDCSTISGGSQPDTDMIQPIPDAEMVQESSRELNLQNFPTELRPSLRLSHRPPQRIEAPDQQRMTGVLPFAAAYLVDLHYNVFPHTPEYKLAIPPIAIAHHHEGNADFLSDSEFLSNDYTDSLGLISSPELPAPQRTLRERFIEHTLSKYYRCYDHDGHRRTVLEFSAYYVAQALAGHEIPDDYNHADRIDARNRLCTMLEQNNMQLLTHCYWISSTVMSYDRVRLHLAFLEDCIDCIETSTTYLGRVLRPWIRLMVLNHCNEYNHYAAQSPRLSSSALEQFGMNFDAPKELEQSMDYLDQHGHGGCHTYLILRLYRTWYRGHQGDPTDHTRELLDCLPLLESNFGTAHLLTINCISMVARGYEKVDNPLAKYYVDTALSRLESCSKMMLARVFELEMKAAQYRLAEGHLLEARHKLEGVLSYRQQHQGAQAPTTWEAAEMLFSTMTQQGLNLEAQQRRAKLQARYEEEWHRHPMINFDSRQKFHRNSQAYHQK